MAKITNQSIPPELVDNYIKVANTRINLTTSQATAHINRQKYNKPYVSTSTRENKKFRVDAEALVKRFHPNYSKKAMKNEITRVSNEMLQGAFDPQYFYELQPSQVQQRKVTMTSTLRSPQLPYGYPLASNMQTVSTYGTVLAEPSTLSYSGRKEGSQFNDKHLNYMAAFFWLDDYKTTGFSGNMYALIDTKIDATASHRASRPMLSLLYEATDCGQLIPETYGKTPLSRSSKQIYFNYDIPPTPSPHFAITLERPIVKRLSNIKPDSGGGGNLCVCFRLGNKPMFGYGFNNNDSVDTTLEATVRIFAPRKIARPVDKIYLQASYGDSVADLVNYPLGWYTDIEAAYISYQYHLGIFQSYMNSITNSTNPIRYEDRFQFSRFYQNDTTPGWTMNKLRSGSVGNDPKKFWNGLKAWIQLTEKYLD